MTLVLISGEMEQNVHYVGEYESFNSTYLKIKSAKYLVQIN